MKTKIIIMIGFEKLVSSGKLNLADKPTIRNLGRWNTKQKVDFIIDYCRWFNGYEYHLNPDKLKLKENTIDFLNFIRSKYKRETGEVFSHPSRFYQLGGDCDCQTIYFLCHQKFLHSSLQGNTNVHILKNKKFYHITQSVNDKIVDFLPYPIPNGTKIIYTVRF